MDDFEVRGAAELRRLAKALNDAADVELRKALTKGLRAAVTRHKPKVAEVLAEALPTALKAKGARVSQTVSVNAGRDPGVTVGIRFAAAGRGVGFANARLVNQRGEIRHRVFGGNVWVTQRVGGQGWFDKGWENAAPEIRAELERVMEQVADDVARKAR